MRRGVDHAFDVFLPYAISNGEWVVAYGVGIVVGLVAAGSGAGWLLVGAGMILGFIVALISAIDWRLQLIPDALSYPALVLGLAVSVAAAPIAPMASFLDHLAAAAAAAAVFLAIRIGYRKLRGIEGLGLGDVKIAAAAGAWVGLDGLGRTLLLACAGALATVAILSRLRGMPVGRRMAVPFGTFIAPAIAVVWLGELWGV